MSSGSKKQRAKQLANKANGNIKAKRLLKSGTGLTGGLIPSNYLSDQPFIDYLTTGEQPHYFFYNESKGVAIGDTRLKAGWSGAYRSGLWITDLGVHVTVGKEDGDFHEFIPYSVIDSVEVRTGITKNKFVFQTDRGECRFPTDPSRDPDQAKRYLSNQLTSQSDSRSTATRRPTSRSSSTSSRANASGRYTLSSLQQMDEYEFERLVGNLWTEQGWDTTVTQGSSDRGVDVVAVKEDPFKQRQLIQAKRYSDGNNVGSSEMQKYSGLYARDEPVDAVVVVTTSGFTSEAERVAANRDVKIIDGSKLAEMIEKHNVL